MNRSRGERRKLFNGRSRAARVIGVSVNDNTVDSLALLGATATPDALTKPVKGHKNVRVTTTSSSSIRLERVQTGMQLKHLRTRAFVQVPKQYATPTLRKALFNLSTIDAIKSPQMLKIREVDSDEERGLNELRALPEYVQDPELAKLLRVTQERYDNLTQQIFLEQQPEVEQFPRKVIDTSSITDAKLKAEADKALEESYKALEASMKAQRNADDRGYAPYEVSKPEAFEPINAKQQAEIDRIKKQVTSAADVDKQVYEELSNPIDYLELYHTVMRGEQEVMSHKLLREVSLCEHAIHNFTENELKNVNTHRVATIVWRLMNSRDLDEASVSTMLRFVDLLPEARHPPLIRHNPELMKDSWIVEAFNNRNNPNYSQELIKGAMAADSDLNRFKLFLTDIERTPRRLNVFLGLHYLKSKRIVPADGIEAFLRGLNYCRFYSQVNTFLNVIVTANPGLVVPPRAAFEAMRAAHMTKHYSTVLALSNYVRKTVGVSDDVVLPMDFHTAMSVVDSLQEISKGVKKNLDFDLESETTAVLQDQIARGNVPPIYYQDLGEAFKVAPGVIAEKLKKREEAAAAGKNKKGSSDAKDEADKIVDLVIKDLTKSFGDADANEKILQRRQRTLTQPDEDCFVVNIQNFLLPQVSVTALSYALNSLRKHAIENDKMFARDVRIYLPNMQILTEYYKQKRRITDIVDNSADTTETVLTPELLAELPLDKEGNVRVPYVNKDSQQELRNLTMIMDAVDIFRHVEDEKVAEINPYNAHLVEQSMPSLAYNKHIYDDVIDTIHMKTGVGKGLRGPRMIDQYTMRNTLKFLARIGINNYHDYVNIDNAKSDVQVDLRNGCLTIPKDLMNVFRMTDISSFTEAYDSYSRKKLEAMALHERYVDAYKRDPIRYEVDRYFESHATLSDLEPAAEGLLPPSSETNMNVVLRKSLRNRDLASGHIVDDASSEDDLGAVGSDFDPEDTYAEDYLEYVKSHRSAVAEAKKMGDDEGPGRGRHRDGEDVEGAEGADGAEAAEGAGEGAADADAIPKADSEQSADADTSSKSNKKSKRKDIPVSGKDMERLVQEATRELLGDDASNVNVSFSFQDGIQVEQK